MSSGLSGSTVMVCLQLFFSNTDFNSFTLFSVCTHTIAGFISVPNFAVFLPSNIFFIFSPLSNFKIVPTHTIKKRRGGRAMTTPHLKDSPLFKQWTTVKIHITINDWVVNQSGLCRLLGRSDNNCPLTDGQGTNKKHCRPIARGGPTKIMDPLLTPPPFLILEGFRQLNANR